MSQKRAKVLRRIAKSRMSTTPGQEADTSTRGFIADGRNQSSAINHPSTFRAVYQRLKRGLKK